MVMMCWAGSIFTVVVGLDLDNGDSAVGDDSDSIGNSKSGKSSTNTPPLKEKKKPFFKKVSALPHGGRQCPFYPALVLQQK